MFRSLDDVISVCNGERESTAKLLAALTDASLTQRVTEEGRTLGRIAWHVVLSIPEMLRAVGLPVEGPGENDPVPAKAAEIAEAYSLVSQAVLETLPAAWDDATLQEERMMYGESWKNGYTLLVLMQHQTHHRGQMTVLMRQAGLRVAGVCGPSREEWEAYGMPVAD